MDDIPNISYLVLYNRRVFDHIFLMVRGLFFNTGQKFQLIQIQEIMDHVCW